MVVTVFVVVEVTSNLFYRRLWILPSVFFFFFILPHLPQYHSCCSKNGSPGCTADMSLFSILTSIWFTFDELLQGFLQYLLLLHCLTLTASSKFEHFWVFMTHPVDYINLLQGLSDCIFVLGITWYISCPELQQKNKYYHTFSLPIMVNVPMLCI